MVVFDKPFPDYFFKIFFKKFLIFWEKLFVNQKDLQTRQAYLVNISPPGRRIK